MEIRIIGEIEDFRKDSVKKGKCLICFRKITLINIKKAIEKQNRKLALIKKGLISYDKNKPAFINYDRDLKYEAWVEKELWEIIKQGKLAKICSKGEEPTYINKEQVFLKCNHCNKITNLKSRKGGGK